MKKLGLFIASCLAMVGLSACKPATYTITWMVEGNVVETDEGVKKGEMPTYDGETPTKRSTSEFKYEFDTWTPEVVPAVANATYTATFTETRINWTSAERELMTEFFGTIVPYFEGAATWVRETTDEYDCIFTETTLSVEEVEAIIVTEFEYLGSNDYADWFSKSISYFDEAQIAVFATETGTAVEGYLYSTPDGPETLEEVIGDFANAMFKDPTAYNDDGEGGYWTAGKYAASGFENDLELFAETIMYYIVPEYVVIVTPLSESTLTTGDACFITEGLTRQSVYVNMLFYASSSYFVAQFSVESLA